MNTNANPVAASASSSRDNPCYGNDPTVATLNVCADDERSYQLPYAQFLHAEMTPNPALKKDADAPPEASAEEIAYLCRAVNRYLARPARPADVVWKYAGVRPLYDDGPADPSAVTRDYTLRLDDDAGGGRIRGTVHFSIGMLSLFRPASPPRMLNACSTPARRSCIAARFEVMPLLQTVNTTFFRDLSSLPVMVTLKVSGPRLSTWMLMASSYDR